MVDYHHNGACEVGMVRMPASLAAAFDLVDSDCYLFAEWNYSSCEPDPFPADQC